MSIYDGTYIYYGITTKTGLLTDMVDSSNTALNLIETSPWFQSVPGTPNDPLVAFSSGHVTEVFLNDVFSQTGKFLNYNNLSTPSHMLLPYKFIAFANPPNSQLRINGPLNPNTYAGSSAYRNVSELVTIAQSAEVNHGSYGNIGWVYQLSIPIQLLIVDNSLNYVIVNNSYAKYYWSCIRF